MHWPGTDSAHFVIYGSADKCNGASRTRGLILLRAVSGGNGILMLIRPGAAPVTGSYPVLVRGDTTTPRGALVSVRFMTGEIARGFALDSGSLSLDSARQRFTIRVRGSGLDYAAGQRASLTALAKAVPVGSDSTDCRMGP